MAPRIDKEKLTASIMNVGNARISGVQHGATVNAEKPELVAQNAPKTERSDQAGQGAMEATRGQDVAPVSQAPAVDPADAKTERIAFLCTPTVKKHLKRLAIDKDKDVSKLILEALASKGYLP
ncbi:MAG: hypothetical protein IT554_11490 [Sphingomonadaceae bacterium]|nr:hypothetical protein [Sphingomonadaceae bacterium]